jgi:hypothetical protein
MQMLAWSSQGKGLSLYFPACPGAEMSPEGKEDKEQELWSELYVTD